MTTITLPQTEGEYTPAEARQWMDAQTQEENLAGDPQLDQRVIKFTQETIIEWTQRMRGLHRRWRGTYKMLAGNTLEQSGPEDVHVPEIYKSIETLVPRIEEAILEKDPWFRIVPRRKAYRGQAEAVSAYVDWQFDQANVRQLIQPAIRNMLVAQCAAFYIFWENRERVRNVRTIEREFVGDKLVKRVKTERKKVIDYSGPAVRLVDPFDFIIDTKATNPQNAIFVGHRAFLTIDEIERLGKELGWNNLDKLRKDTTYGSSFGYETDYYKWSRDPTSRYSTDPNLRYEYKPHDRPARQEVVFLHSRFDMSGGSYDWRDVRMAVAGGRVVLELRENPNDGQFRPYATCRSTSNGHEFYGTGTFDNAIRLNQHLDLFHQVFLRGSKLMASPIGFAEEESMELPDSIYKVTPGKIYKGTGPIRFTQIPDGMLRAAPLVLSTLQRNIEETVGSFRIDMGQQVGNTATEATLSLQEGNRRTRGLVRAMGDGLEQLLEGFYRLDLQYSNEDVEFPVLGKRALDMKKTHLNVGPADLLDDVRFDLVGLHSLRTNGLKATGWIQSINALQPFMVANPQAIDQVGIMHDVVSELVGPEEANQRVRVPTPVDQLRSQEEENEGLITGTEIDVDPDDDDPDHIKKIEPLVEVALDKRSKMHREVRRCVLQHWMQHKNQEAHKQATKAAVDARQPQQMLGLPPPEAGGQPNANGSAASPQAGGLSDAMTQLASEPGGQTPMENPGPADNRKYAKPGRKSRTTNQTENAP